MSDLKPCPFCGGMARLFNVGHRTWKVMCVKCLSQTNAHFGELNAIRTWNRRANDENA